MTDKTKMRKRLIGLGPEMLADILLNIAGASDLLMNTILIAEQAVKLQKKIRASGPAAPKQTGSSSRKKSSFRSIPPQESDRSKGAMVLKISLLETDPPVWRRVLVPASADLGYLHGVFQIAMGWTNSHLHSFTVGTKLFEDQSLKDGFDDMESEDELKVSLAEVLPLTGAKIHYEYDFGDSWGHSIELEEIRPWSKSCTPICEAGANACPPEDCGGTDGFDDFKRIMADPEDEEHEEMKKWFGGPFDPSAFDIGETNRHLSLLGGIRGPITQDKLGEILIKRYGLDL